MEIRNLKNTPISDIVQTISDSFADYFVPLPTDVPYWENRFKGARVDLELSYGVFEQNKLSGFIINGVDYSNGLKTAFNTGTGVTKASRGQGLVGKLYDYAIPHLKEQDVRCCSLEVISQNERAIHVYERIGFHINKRLKCFKGTLPIAEEMITVKEISVGEIETQIRKTDHYYSWDNTSAAIKASGNRYKVYQVIAASGKDAGYFIINPSNDYLVQFEPSGEKTEDAQRLLDGVATITTTVKINNVDTHRTHIISSYLKAGLDNYIDQYEMQMMIP